MLAFKYYRLELEISVYDSYGAYRASKHGLDERVSHVILVRRPADEVFPSKHDLGGGTHLVEEHWMNMNRSRLIAKFGSEDNFSVTGSIPPNCCQEITEAHFKEARFLLDSLAMYEASDAISDRVHSDFIKKRLY